ncbi:metallophosphoesterase [Acetivibrio sp. MSJd-27]|jgi:uncharacterized protein|uniref:metallophosphoesterase n=1 Tax=Acetivibrio sp. MSJd-27 TaxID=2841523 RepID=UPI001C10B25F|nr:metallophosphoesterase [Acetivibrio sp. MSJd-27]MBU5449728.1 metallophosphoesterase [Acetivibrio sp. MSJd-27]
MKIIVVLLGLIGCIALLIWFLYDQNNRLCVSEHSIHSEKLNASFSAVHLSDLHNKSFGRQNKKLLEKVRELKPDVIFYTGDVIYKRSKYYQTGIRFLYDANQIAPVYMILGNHECEYPYREEVIRKIRETGVHLLINQTLSISVKGNTIPLLGMAERLITKQEVKQIAESFERERAYKILLSHFPHYFSHFRQIQYKDYKIDLILCGHTHGAQIILPLIGGICAPQQGFFPKYYRDMYEENDTKMIVSRGLGKSIFPFRIFNRPEIIQIHFEAKK